MQLVWLVVAILFGIAEVVTPTLTLVWFSIGALIVMFLSKFIESILIQVILFGVISVTMLIVATKRIVKKDEGYEYDTNLKAIINKIGIVKKDILPNKTGIVVIEGEEWSAISIDNKEILSESEVKVIKIEGVKVIVQKI